MEKPMVFDKEHLEPTPDPRYQARIAIFIALDRNVLLSNYSLNMSTGGVFIETVAILPVDTSLIAKFKLPGKDAIISCKARVAWVNEQGHFKKSDLPSGMGLQFIDLSLQDLHAIRGYLVKGDLVPTW
jgi:uncharacterized protein (TIGR02266 family)